MLTYYNSCGKITVLKVRNENLKNMKNISDITGYDYDPKVGFFEMIKSPPTPSKRTILKNANDIDLNGKSFLYEDGSLVDIVKQEIGDLSYESDDVVRLVNEIANLAVEEALYWPLRRKMESPNFDNIRNMMHLFEGPMGTGKTWLVAHKLAQKWFELGKKLLVYMTPETSALSDVVSEFESWKESSNSVDVEIIYSEDGNGKHGKLDVDDILHYIQNGKKVIYICNHHKICTKGPASTRRQLFFEQVAIENDLVLFTDEVHTWLISGKGNQLSVRGSSSGNYKGALYDFISKKIASNTSWVFGASATVTVEHTGDIKTLGAMKFDIVNSKEVSYLLKFLVFRRKYKETISTFDANNTTEVNKVVEEVVQYLVDGPKNADVKRTATIQCDLTKDFDDRSWDREYMDIADAVSAYYKAVVSKMPNFNPKNAYIGVSINEDPDAFMGGGNFTMTNTGQFGEFQLTQNEMYEMLMDKDDPLIILLSVYKGTASINVNNFSVGVQHRQSDKKTGVKCQPYATHAVKQFVGRLYRVMKNVVKGLGKYNSSINAPSPDTQKFYEGSPNPIDNAKYAIDCNDTDLEKLLHAESYKAFLAETPCNKLAIEELDNDFSIDVETAYEEMLKLRNLVGKQNSAYNHLAKISQKNGMKFEKSAMNAVSKSIAEGLK